MKLLLLFIILNVVNVVMQTIRSLATVKCGKMGAAIANAVSYGLYTVVLVYMVCDLPLWEKVTIVAAANFIGVYFVKIIEEKMRKDKMWKIEMTIVDNGFTAAAMHGALNGVNIPNHYFSTGKHAVFSCFCATKADTDKALEVGKIYGAKTFASETRLT